MSTCVACGFGPLLVAADSDPAGPLRCGNQAACAARAAGYVVLTPLILRRALAGSETCMAAVRRALKCADGPQAV